jgi:hypothetical protein
MEFAWLVGGVDRILPGIPWIVTARAATSPHVQKWSSEALLFIKSSLVANKTFYPSEL